MAGQFRVGDIGSEINVTVTELGKAVNISSATTLLYKLKKPSGAVIERTPSFLNTGTDGKLQYLTISGDLDEDGPWIGQAFVVLSNGQWHTEMFSFPVGANLS